MTWSLTQHLKHHQLYILCRIKENNDLRCLWWLSMRHYLLNWVTCSWKEYIMSLSLLFMVLVIRLKYTMGLGQLYNIIWSPNCQGTMRNRYVLDLQNCKKVLYLIISPLRVSAENATPDHPSVHKTEIGTLLVDEDRIKCRETLLLQRLMFLIKISIISET